MIRRAVFAAGSALFAAHLFSSSAQSAAEPRTDRPAQTLSSVRWSEDSSFFVGLADEAGKGAAFQAYDGVTGRPTWTIPLDRLRDPVGGKRLKLDRWEPSADSGQLLIESSGDLFVASAGSGPAVRQLTRTKNAEAGARLSPDGTRVAFERDGDLWAIELASGEERRLTNDGRPPSVVNGGRPFPGTAPFGGDAGFEWAPESRTIAYLRQEGGAVRLGTVNVITLTPQLVDTGVPGAGRLEEVRWRFDSRALGVERRAVDGTRLELMLCQPERLYCRRFAARPVAPEDPPRRDLDFFGDGFVWGPAAGHSSGLARYDTLGRERFELMTGAWQFEELERLDEPDGAVLVRASNSEVGGGVEHGLLRLSLTERSSPVLLAAGGSEEWAVAPNGSAYVLTYVEAGGTRRRELRSLNGKRITPLPPPVKK